MQFFKQHKNKIIWALVILLLIFVARKVVQHYFPYPQQTTIHGLIGGPEIIHPRPSSTNTIDINDPTRIVDVDGTVKSCDPGDIIELDKPYYQFVLIKNLRGTALSPITIRNKAGVQVYIGGFHAYALTVTGWYVKILGNTDPLIPYGIHVSGENVPTTHLGALGLFIGGTDIEVTRLEIDHSGSGIQGNDTIYKVKANWYLHHNKIHDLDNPDPNAGGRSEGFYLGSTKPSHYGAPYRFENLRVEYNELYNLAGDGIQAGNVNGLNIIGNTIRNYAKASLAGQRNAIQVGGLANDVKVLYNTIDSGKGNAYQDLGIGKHEVAYNTFKNIEVKTLTNECFAYINDKTGGAGGAPLLSMNMHDNTWQGATSSAAINNATASANTTGSSFVNNCVTGTYGKLYAITSKDSWTGGCNTTTPTVDAGNNITLQLPVDSVVVAGKALNADGTNSRAYWRYIYPATTTQFGILPFGVSPYANKIAVGSSLGVNAQRVNVRFDTYVAERPVTNAIAAAGNKIILHISAGNNILPYTFPTDTTRYKDTLGWVLDTMAAIKASGEAWICLENEEAADNQHSGPITDYINMAKAAVPLAHAKGYKVTNGGVNQIQLCYLTYKDYIDSAKTSEAKAFAARAIDPADLNADGTLKNSNLTASKTLTVDSILRLFPGDAINTHWYENKWNTALTNAMPQVLQEVADFVRRKSGKKLVSSEMGQYNTSPQLATEMLQAATQAGMPFCIWFAGDGSDAQGLYAPGTYTLRSNGTAFKAYMDANPKVDTLPYTITNPYSATTKFKNLKAGSYKFELVGTDKNSGIIKRDTISITVNAAPNVPPVADITALVRNITLPDSVIALAGIGSYDTDGDIVSYAWSGAGATFSAPTAPATNAKFTTAGNYTIRLTVTDNAGATNYKEVNIIVNAAPPPNEPPVVKVQASSYNITLPTNSVTLTSNGTSDSDGTIVSYLWGGDGVSFSNASAASTTVTFTDASPYIIRLTCIDDDGDISYDELTITVNPVPNQPPTANAGVDQSFPLPISFTTLDGSTSSDTDGSIVTYAWSQNSGPNAAIFESANAAVTNVTNLVRGTYYFKLTVTDDKGATATDVMRIDVTAANNKAKKWKVSFDVNGNGTISIKKQ